MGYDNRQKIEYMMEFTRTYADCVDMDIYQRESRCNEIQLRRLMLPLHTDDLLAGRKTCLPVGFAPQSRYNSTGYYCSQTDLDEMKKDPSLTSEQLDNLNYLQRFWKGKTTNEKIYARYSKELLERVTHGNFTTVAGVCFPLYRMSGSQMDPTRLLDLGIGGLTGEAERHAPENPPFFEGVKAALASLRDLCLRYREDAINLASISSDESCVVQLRTMSDNLGHIAWNKPETFWQAMQLCYLFYQASGTSNYGRMDEYLGSYYVRDLNNGTVTQSFARKLMCNLWALIIDNQATWDSRVILGGKDRHNIEDADQFALLAMETSRMTKDTLPQLTLRCYRGMDPKVYNKALEVIGEGTTYPMLYNDDVNIPAVANAFQVDKDVAAKYVPFGCGEYVLYNRSFGTPSGTINLLHGLNRVIYDGEENLLESSPDFDTFYNGYVERMREMVLLMAQQEKLEYDVCAEEAPHLYFSILFDDCLKRGKAIFDGGIRYLGGTLECYGNTNTADSLTAIKLLVYDQKTITPQELTDALKNNFMGAEELRRKLLAAPKFGNDHSYADSMAVRLHEDMCISIRECASKVGLHSYLAVIINNSMNTTFGLSTGASADGRPANAFMANANNPTGGMDKTGITAMLNSLTKLKVDNHAGSVQNLRLSKEMFGSLIDKTKGLLAAYFEEGGSQAMITVLGRDDLESALAHPEQYGNLIVRVGGFSARFVELDKAVQQELMSRTLY